MLIYRSRKSKISKDKIPDEPIRGEICIVDFLKDNPIIHVIHDLKWKVMDQ